MPDQRGVRPPLACRGLVRMASWIVPRRMRTQWRLRWDSGLRDWWILVQRGELTSRAHPQMVRRCWGAVADAFWLRFSKRQFRLWVRGPAFLLVAAAAVLLLTAVFSRGFTATRGLVEITLGLHHPLPHTSQASLDVRENTLVAHIVPIVFALVIGIVLVTIRRLPLRPYGWRYWSLFVLKTMAVMVIVPLLWIEIGASIRAHMAVGPLRQLLGGLVFTWIFIVAFGCALAWSFADQRRRCPVCLQRLAMPVTIGSWASVFEPVTTELLCEEGHGSLCMPETGTGEPDRWTALDASWRELFDSNPKAGR